MYQIISRVVEDIVVLYLGWDLLGHEGRIKTIHIALSRHGPSIESLAWLIVILVALESRLILLLQRGRQIYWLIASWCHICYSLIEWVSGCGLLTWEIYVLVLSIMGRQRLLPRWKGLEMGIVTLEMASFLVLDRWEDLNLVQNALAWHCFGDLVLSLNVASWNSLIAQGLRCGCHEVLLVRCREGRLRLLVRGVRYALLASIVLWLWWSKWSTSNFWYSSILS